jgi:hypothetical protein
MTDYIFAPFSQCEVMRDGFVSCHYALVKQAGGRMSPQSLHVLDETGQLGEFSRDLRLGNESALAPPDLDEAALDQILDRLSHSRAADFELLEQALFPCGQKIETIARPGGYPTPG